MFAARRSQHWYIQLELCVDSLADEAKARSKAWVQAELADLLKQARFRDITMPPNLLLTRNTTSLWHRLYLLAVSPAHLPASMHATPIADLALLPRPQMASALAHVHARGIVHLDVKPDNIYRTAAGAYKLGDFGLATLKSGEWRVTEGDSRCVFYM